MVLIIDIDEFILVVAHVEFLHIGKLAKTMAESPCALRDLYADLPLMRTQGPRKPDPRQDIAGRNNSDVRCYDRTAASSFTVTGYGHVAENIHECDVFTEMVHN